MNKTNTDTPQEDNKKLMELIINKQIAQQRELERVNKLLVNIVSSPEYENNKINIDKRKELISSFNTTLSAQEIINEVVTEMLQNCNNE